MQKTVGAFQYRRFFAVQKDPFVQVAPLIVETVINAAGQYDSQAIEIFPASSLFLFPCSTYSAIEEKTAWGLFSVHPCSRNNFISSWRTCFPFSRRAWYP